MQQKSIVTWITLLAACRWHGDVDRAANVAEKALEIHPNHPTVFVQLGNIYAAAGKMEEASHVREKMRLLGIKKIPGQSWIEIDGVTHTLYASDSSHPKAAEIDAQWRKVNAELQKLGYIPDTSWVLQNISIEQKKILLCKHSEKKAIMLGLISTSPGTPLIIAKNLRMCGDCHEATKLISKVYKREITVRDASRFHHLKDGLCSCDDNW